MKGHCRKYIGVDEIKWSLAFIVDHSLLLYFPHHQHNYVMLVVWIALRHTNHVILKSHSVHFKNIFYKPNDPKRKYQKISFHHVVSINISLADFKSLYTVQNETFLSPTIWSKILYDIWIYITEPLLESFATNHCVGNSLFIR